MKPTITAGESDRSENCQNILQHFCWVEHTPSCYCWEVNLLWCQPDVLSNMVRIVKLPATRGVDVYRNSKLPRFIYK